MESHSKRPRDARGLESLSRSISPPKTKRQKTTNIIPSPFRLTWIRDLDDDSNKDAITLFDLLGDPLISECWNFNYLHDIPFLMEAFDNDIRAQVKLHIVHGFWKREDGNRLRLLEDAEPFPNVKLHVAPMPEMFGTHHSKMLVLFRRDDTAQVVIHTANMIAKDWTNMTNAAWISPLLPKLNNFQETPPLLENMVQGSGSRFKFDLLNYLKSYDRIRPTCTALVENLKLYNFDAVRGNLIASVPGLHDVHGEPGATSWGWDAMAKRLQQIPCQQGESHVAVQISSIATLGGSDEWLRKTLFKALSKGRPAGVPRFKVVFPTADEVRASLDGYASGGSIHTKIQSKQQEMQLRYLRPIFHHWMANDDSKAAEDFLDAGRDRAAPHIKTYIRTNCKNTIDWALVTSANLSKQAWGDAAKPTGQFRIASWEIGVLVWPSLFKDDAIMKGCFKSDVPEPVEEYGRSGEARSLVGFRMPYSLPLRNYSSGETPWVATISHEKKDCLGQSWIL